jgi:hypothetical protein
MTVAAQFDHSWQFGGGDTVLRTGEGQVDRASLPSPEEGCRLIRDFLRVAKPDLREKIFNFVTEMLRVQDEG